MDKPTVSSQAIHSRKKWFLKTFWPIKLDVVVRLSSSFLFLGGSGDVAMANGLAGWSGTRKKHDWEIGDKEIRRRGMWIDLPE